MYFRSLSLKSGTWILTACLATTGWQAGSLPAFAQETGADDLRIVIISGEGFTNNIKKRTAHEQIVEVRDRNNKPIAGATLAFLLPNSGPGGTFANGAHSLTVTTNQAGRAVAMVRPNNVVGAFKINVTASFQGQTATTAITQTNAAVAAGGAGAGGGISGTAIGIGAGVTAAAVATTVAIVKVVGNGSKKAKINIGQPQIP